MGLTPKHAVKHVSELVVMQVHIHSYQARVSTKIFVPLCAVSCRDRLILGWIPGRTLSSQTLRLPLCHPLPNLNLMIQDVVPASAYTGLVRHVGTGTSLQAFVQEEFHLNVLEPGLMRLTNCHDEVLAPGTLASNLLKPRMVYMHVTCYFTFKHLEKFISEQAHHRPLTDADERAVSKVSVRFFLYYYSSFRASDRLARMLEIQNRLNQELQTRIRDLEQTIHGQMQQPPNI